MSDNKLTEFTTDIVSAYVGQNTISVDELAVLIQTTYAALTQAADGPIETVPDKAQMPAVSVKKSITPDFLISLEDGQKYKSLKRHLRTKYDMSPEDYRAKWNLPKDYPMVAPAYSASRSLLAKSMGLGVVKQKSATVNVLLKPRATAST